MTGRIHYENQLVVKAATKILSLQGAEGDEAILRLPTTCSKADSYALRQEIAASG